MASGRNGQETAELAEQMIMTMSHNEQERSPSKTAGRPVDGTLQTVQTRKESGGLDGLAGTHLRYCSKTNKRSWWDTTELILSLLSDASCWVQTPPL